MGTNRRKWTRAQRRNYQERRKARAAAVAKRLLGGERLNAWDEWMRDEALREAKRLGLRLIELTETSMDEIILAAYAEQFPSEHSKPTALQLTTQALKDILNAADNGQPYTPEELRKSFQKDYNAGYEALQAQGLEEIA